jgi:SET domain-containing protein
MQKWSVNGLSRMALFALRDIKDGEELSYDYNFSLYNPSEGQVRYRKTDLEFVVKSFVIFNLRK